MSIVPPGPELEPYGGAGMEPLAEPGLADVVTLQRRIEAQLGDGDEHAFYVDTIAEYQWARDARLAWRHRRWTSWSSR